MAAEVAGKVMGWFVINSDLSQHVSAGTGIDTASLAAVAFDVDVVITFDDMGYGFELSAYTPIGIDYNNEKFVINVDANMFAMKA